MSGEPRKNCAITIWRWADNDLPGMPTRIHAALLRGEMPPEVQPFDSRPLLAGLERVAAKARLLGDEWSWHVAGLPGSTGSAALVFLSCTEGPAFNFLEAMGQPHWSF